MGLQAAHERGIVHRDLKPANIFIVPLPGTARVLVKILDFGISKALDAMNPLTKTFSVMGTPYYMAPEQAKGGSSALDARADQFSLAAIAYELLSARIAFEGDGMVNVIYKVVNEQPPSFASLGVVVPDGVEAVILRGMSKSPEDRFASVQELSDALKRAAQGQALAPRPAPTGRRRHGCRRPRRRGRRVARTILGAGIAAAVVAAVAAALVVALSRRTPPPAPVAPAGRCAARAPSRRRRRAGAAPAPPRPAAVAPPPRAGGHRVRPGAVRRRGAPCVPAEIEGKRRQPRQADETAGRQRVVAGGAAQRRAMKTLDRRSISRNALVLALALCAAPRARRGSRRQGAGAGSCCVKATACSSKGARARR